MSENNQSNPCNPDDYEQPELEQLEQWEAEGFSQAVDGCLTEPAGHCPHGCRSWLLELGLI